MPASRVRLLYRGPGCLDNSLVGRIAVDAQSPEEIGGGELGVRDEQR
jgi:hypothetical protein